MAIPCIVFYVLQLFIDTFIATGWASKYEKAGELRAKYSKELDELARMDTIEEGGEEGGDQGVKAKEGAKGSEGGSAAAAASEVNHSTPLAPPASNEIQAQGLISGPLFSNPLFSPAASNDDERAGLLSSKQ